MLDRRIALTRAPATGSSSSSVSTWPDSRDSGVSGMVRSRVGVARCARSREVVVKILADVQPVPPVGPFQPVEFEGLMVTPYVDGKSGRLAFSYRATAIVEPKTLAQVRKAA